MTEQTQRSNKIGLSSSGAENQLPFASVENVGSGATTQHGARNEQSPPQGTVIIETTQQEASRQLVSRSAAANDQLQVNAVLEDVNTLEQRLNDTQIEIDNRVEATETRVAEIEQDVAEIKSQLSAFNESNINNINESSAELFDIKSQLLDMEQNVDNINSNEIMPTIGSQEINNTFVVADLIYQGVVAVGAVLSITAALVVSLGFELYAIGALLVVLAVFFVWTFKRGLQPIHV